MKLVLLGLAAQLYTQISTCNSGNCPNVSPEVINIGLTISSQQGADFTSPNLWLLKPVSHTCLVVIFIFVSPCLKCCSKRLIPETRPFPDPPSAFVSFFLLSPQATSCFAARLTSFGREERNKKTSGNVI